VHSNEIIFRGAEVEHATSSICMYVCRSLEFHMWRIHGRSGLDNVEVVD
jgi:hypothetical protein